MCSQISPLLPLLSPQLPHQSPQGAKPGALTPLLCNTCSGKPESSITSILLLSGVLNVITVIFLPTSLYLYRTTNEFLRLGQKEEIHLNGNLQTIPRKPPFSEGQYLAITKQSCHTSVLFPRGSSVP